MSIEATGPTAVYVPMNWTHPVEIGRGAEVDRTGDFECLDLRLGDQAGSEEHSVGLRKPRPVGAGKEEFKALAGLVAGGMAMHLSALSGLVAGALAMQLSGQVGMPPPAANKGGAGAPPPAAESGADTSKGRGAKSDKSDTRVSTGYSFADDKLIGVYLLLTQVISATTTSQRGFRGMLDTMEYQAGMNEAKSMRRSAYTTLGTTIGASVANVGVTMYGASKAGRGLNQQKKSILQNASTTNKQGVEASGRGKALSTAKDNQAALQKMKPKAPGVDTQSKPQGNKDLDELGAVVQTPHQNKAAEASNAHELLDNKGKANQNKGNAIMQMGPVAGGLINGAGQAAAGLESATQKVQSANASVANKASGNERDNIAANEAFINQLFNLIMGIVQAQMGLMAAVGNMKG